MDTPSVESGEQPNETRWAKMRGHLANLAIGGAIDVLIFATLFVGLSLAFIVHEDTVVGDQYTKLFAAHPNLIATQLTAVGSLHVMSDSAVVQGVLTVALVVATAIYAVVARQARKDAQKAIAAAAEASHNEAAVQLRSAAALERIATAMETDAARPGAPEIRAAIVLDLRRSG